MMEKAFTFQFDGSSALRMNENGEECHMQYYLDDAPIAKSLCSVLNPLQADIVDVAAGVHIADRQMKRAVDSEAWQRHIIVKIHVRLPHLWRKPSVYERLSKLLHFMTGDDWTIEFCSRPTHRRPSEQQGFLFRLPDDGPVSVALLSGGLDAFAGVSQSILEQPDRHFICVSGTPNNRHEHRQREQTAVLRQALRPRSLTSIRVPCWLRSAEESLQERSRRSRGFLFLALGAVAAMAAGTNRLILYENGIGAINLSYERVPVGIPNSRAVHPQTVLMFSDFIRNLTDQEFGIENPSAFQTKAEMCAGLAQSQVRKAVSLTFSCDGFPVRRACRPQCGVCTSCLLRRLALFTADLNELDQDSYGCNLLTVNSPISEARLKGLFAMDWQVGRLELSLKSSSSWSNLVREFPELQDVRDGYCGWTGTARDEIQSKIIRLYTQHCQEWDSFPVRRLIQYQEPRAA